MGDPPEEAYGRVTDPQRYALLHDAARALLDRLEREHDVERAEGLDLDPELAGQPFAASLVRLTPRDRAAAPLTVLLTSFPGVHVRLGRWYHDALPHCGCDACDEDGDQLAEDLLQLAEAAVTGRFTEELTGGDHPELRFSLAFDGGGSSGTTPLDRGRAAALGPPAELLWRPWPARER